MEFGSKYVYLGNQNEDEEEVKVTESDDVVLSDSDVSDDDGETCLLDILDTAGQEEYSSLKDQYVRSGNGFVIIYSIIDQESFKEAEAIHRWLKRLKEEDCHVILVANKQDLKAEATVSTEDGHELAERLGVSLFETSALDGSGVTDAMKGLVRIMPRTGSDYKIVMLGTGAVGKSSITIRFVNDTFVDDYDPTIEDTYRTLVSVDGLQAGSKETRKAAKKARKIAKKLNSLPQQQSPLFSLQQFQQQQQQLQFPQRQQPPPTPEGLPHSSGSDVSDDDGETCLLDILDTAGQEEYSSLKDQYVRSGNGFVIIYSIIDQESFKEAEAIYRWLKRLKEEDCRVILVANKQDLKAEATVSAEDGHELAERLGVSLFETSALDGSGVTDAMKGLVRIMPRTGSDYKIVMLGTGAVGKSSITIRFVNDTFVDDYDPTIEDTYRTLVSVDGLQAGSKETRKAAKKARRRAKKLNSLPQQQHPFFSSRQMLQQQQQRPFISSQQQQQQRLQFAELLHFAKQLQFAQQQQQEPSVKVKKERKADGNVVLISLRTLEEEPNLVTGDPIRCKNCEAVLTATAVLESDGDKKIWNCEFCKHVNRGLDLEDDEIPRGDCLDYMLSPATRPTVEEEASTVEDDKKEKTSPGVIVYCMDISKSMMKLCDFPESQTSWMQERLGVTDTNCVSRLDCIQTAVQRLAEQLKADQLEKQILLVVFGSQVYVKAGGSVECLPSFESMDNYYDYGELLSDGIRLCNDYPLKPIEESYDEIAEAVQTLKTGGKTALGPALSICMGYASSIPSSEIVLCTDGKPNVGVGKLKGHGSYRFYEMVGKYARSKNVTINILAVGSDPVGLQTISGAAEHSGGTTNKLNPAEIVRQLRTIAQNEVVATSVSVRFFLHPEFVFDEPEYGENLSQLEKEVGSARKETDLTFRFKLRDPSKRPEIDTVPFQIQIVYTKTNGMKCLRVLSKTNEATTSRKDMEENISVSVLSVSTMRTTAQLAKGGQGVQAQHMLKNVKRLVTRGAKSSEQKEAKLAFYNDVEAWDDRLTYHNQYFGKKHQSDESSNMIHQAQVMNSHRSDVGSSKMTKVMARRKMSKKSKDAYYSYKSYT